MYVVTSRKMGPMGECLHAQTSKATFSARRSSMAASSAGHPLFLAHPPPWFQQSEPRFRQDSVTATQRRCSLCRCLRRMQHAAGRATEIARWGYICPLPRTLVRRDQISLHFRPRLQTPRQHDHIRSAKCFVTDEPLFKWPYHLGSPGEIFLILFRLALSKSGESAGSGQRPYAGHGLRCCCSGLLRTPPASRAAHPRI